MMDRAIMDYRSRVAMAVQTTALAAQGYLAPSPGAKSQILRCIVTMGNAADLVLTAKTADDAAGTNAAALAADVPIFKDGIAQTAAKALTVGDATGNYIVDFVIDPAIIPAGKYVGMSYANSHASNLMCCLLIEDAVYQPTPAA